MHLSHSSHVRCRAHLCDTLHCIIGGQVAQSKGSTLCEPQPAAGHSILKSLHWLKPASRGTHEDWCPLCCRMQHFDRAASSAEQLLSNGSLAGLRHAKELLLVLKDLQCCTEHEAKVPPQDQPALPVLPSFHNCNDKLGSRVCAFHLGTPLTADRSWESARQGCLKGVDYSELTKRTLGVPTGSSAPSLTFCAHQCYDWLDMALP